MRHLKTCLCALILILLSATAYAQSNAKKIKIGVLAPLSGDVSTWGIDTQRALKLANEMHGNGKFELIFEDDRCTGKAAVTAAQKLIGVDKIDVGMVVCTEPTLAAAPIFNQNKIIVVAPGATAAAVSDAGDYIFRTWPSDFEMAKITLDKIMELHPKRVVVISESRGFPQEFAKSLSQLAETADISLSQIDFQTSDTDLAAIVLRAKSSNPDAVILNTDSDRTLLKLFSEIKRIKWNIPIFSNYLAGTAAFGEHAGNEANGIKYGDAPSIDCRTNPSTAGCDVFLEFIKRYGPIQSSEYMVASSIAAFLVVAQMAESSKDHREFLYNTKFSSLIGDFYFDSNGDVVGPKHSLKEVGATSR